MRSKFVVCLFVVFACVSAASAQYVDMYRIDRLVKNLPEDGVLSAAAASLGISADTLRQEKSQYKATVGELFVAHQIAMAGKVDFTALMTEARGGKFWGVLAKEKNVNMDSVTKSVREFEKALKKVQRTSK